jgi:hypothetical protein
MGLRAVIHGESGAGPLVVSTSDEQPGLVHVGWPGGGMWLDRRQRGKLSDALASVCYEGAEERIAALARRKVEEER